MKGLMIVAWLIFSITSAAADRATERLTDNPAFCFGFLSAQSPKQADALAQYEMKARTFFAKVGPKDSTDERGFNAWEKIGRNAAFNQNFLEKCRQLLGTL